MNCFKSWLSLLLLLLAQQSIAQYGFLRLETDSVKRGYIRVLRNASTGTTDFEVWKTKKDKIPERIPKSSVVEYSLGKDTIKTLRDFKPFEDREIYFGEVDAHYVVMGKINLLKIDRKGDVTPTSSGVVLQIMARELRNDVYILEVKNDNLLKAMPFKKQRMDSALLEFFPKRFLELYEEKREKIKLERLAKLVEFYNSKN